MLDQVGLGDALDRPIGKFSKGMMQRMGLAQALLHDPELLVLDEPMSGLDPIGRKEVRELLESQRRQGKTLLMTSHILTDIEMVCDRVTIVNRGKKTAEGALNELLRPDVRRTEIELERVADELNESLRKESSKCVTANGRVCLTVEGEDAVPAILKQALAGGAKVVSVTPHKETLEELFVRNAMASSEKQPSEVL